MPSRLFAARDDGLEQDGRQAEGEENKKVTKFSALEVRVSRHQKVRIRRTKNCVFSDTVSR